jgi:putative FmdB family regulatory protein
MPIYEYRCIHCSHKFEKLVSVNADGIVCPECGHDDCSKLFSTFGFSTGDGFSSSVGSECGGCSKGSCQGCKH